MNSFPWIDIARVETDAAWTQILPEQMNEKMVRQVVHTEQMTIARLEMKAGTEVPAHQHHNAQLSMVVSGKVKFFVSGIPVIVAAGQLLELKPDQPHGVEVLEDSVVVDLFTPPREDWIRGDDAYLRSK